MPALRLKALLEQHGVTQRALAKAAGVSPATMTGIVSHGLWPKRASRTAIREAVVGALLSGGVPEAATVGIFESVTSGRTRPNQARAAETQKEASMLMRRQGLFPATKRHFGLSVDPFDGDLSSHDDVFLSESIRYVRESMYHVARHGGFLAVIGESGSGKSTLRRDLIGRIAAEGLPVKVVEPYVLGMEDNDKTGKTLRAMHIAEAILATVAPLRRAQGSPEACFRQLHEVMRESRRAGQSHCLIIEEAHGLSIPTIKHLKRFWELEDGFKKLLSIILIGQPELRQRLAETSHEVREVVQRCEVVELKALNGDLGDYLRFKLSRAGGDLAKVINEQGIEALRDKLTGPTGRGGAAESVSLCYPLAVGNMLVAAMNLATEIGAPVVDAQVVRAL
jgi:type II secretory pathway predicted ATPase ExeA